MKEEKQLSSKSENMENTTSKLISNTDIALPSIESMIMNIRGVQVMLDRDLAKLYGVETKVLNQAVRRNLDRFPADFMFQLTMDECSRSQIVTLNGKRGQNIKYLPYVFTENGIAMLSSVLRSPLAIATNIQIMRTFTKLRQSFLSSGQIMRRLELVEFHQLELNEHVEEIFKRLDQESVISNQGIFYQGQVFDAYTFASDLIKSAINRIVLIDNYIDESVLLMLSKRQDGVSTLIVKQLNNFLSVRWKCQHADAMNRVPTGYRGKH